MLKSNTTITHAKSKRRKLLVERQVQGALGLRIAAHWSMFFVVTLLLTISLRLIGNLHQADWLEMVGQALREQSIAIIVILALLPWFVHDAFKLSNRFAGPVVRLRGAIRSLSRSDEVTPLQFRKGDFWGDLASEFNELQSRISSEREELQRLREEVEALRLSPVRGSNRYREIASAGGNG